MRLESSQEQIAEEEMAGIAINRAYREIQIKTIRKAIQVQIDSKTISNIEVLERLSYLEREFLLVLLNELKDTVERARSNPRLLLIVVSDHCVSFSRSRLSVSEYANVVAVDSRLDEAAT